MKFRVELSFVAQQDTQKKKKKIEIVLKYFLENRYYRKIWLFYSLKLLVR